MQRSESLDGVRGLAAVSVLLFHAGYLPMGWLGVPAFFALSGYLITRQLAAGMDAGTFWRRRAIRLLPLLGLYLTLNLALVIAQGRDPSGYAWHYLGLSNALIASGAAAQHGHVGHLWSIAIEIQAYAVWPLILAAGRHAKALLFAAAVAALAVWAVLGNDAIMTGCSAFFAIGGLAALRGWQPLVIRVPAPLTAIGRASYSIYLWQMMCVGAAIRLGFPLLGVAASIAIGLLSARYLEDVRWLQRLCWIDPHWQCVGPNHAPNPTGR